MIENESEDNDPPEWDIIVLGAGPSGLAAALKAQELGKTVLVLEARDRVGGRCFGHHGAGYVDAAHRRVRQVVSEVGLEFEKVHDTGVNVLEALPNQFRAFKGSNLPKGQSLRTLLALARILSSIEVNSSMLDPSEPWNFKGAKELHEISVYDYFKSRTKDVEALSVLKAALRPVFGSELEDISLLWFLFFCRSSQSLSRLLSVTNGAQEFKIKLGGFEEMCKRMASRIESPSALHTGCIVTKVRLGNLHGGCVLVECSDAARFSAKRCIIAFQPSLYRTILFQPELQARKLDLAESFEAGVGTYTKCRLGFETPWWRVQKFSGQIASCSGPASYYLDDSTESKGPGLMAFITAKEEGQRWRELADTSLRLDALFDQLCRSLPNCLPISRPISYDEFDWGKEVYTNGCVLCLPPNKSSLDSWKSIRAPEWEERLFFAGTETATISEGYVDGAIQAGHRASLQAIASIERKPFFFEIKEPEEKSFGDSLRERRNDRGWLEHFIFGRKIDGPKLLQKIKDLKTSA